MLADFVRALGGGVLIGLAAGLFKLLNGRILGISGLTGGLIGRWTGPWAENVLVLVGSIAGVGAYAALVGLPSLSIPEVSRLVVAGLLVGFGSRLGNGCTSGHAVCGLARFSPRSMVATALFLVGGVVTVLAMKAV